MDYYLKDKTMNPAWVDQKADEIAAKLVKKNFMGGIDKRGSINSSQLRKFYAEVKNIERIWTSRQDVSADVAFKDVLPLIKILKAKVAYARSREVVPEAFEKWLQEHVNNINSPEDFRVFLLHFEAVVGFCYGRGLND